MPPPVVVFLVPELVRGSMVDAGALDQGAQGVGVRLADVRGDVVDTEAVAGDLRDHRVGTAHALVQRRDRLEQRVRVERQAAGGLLDLMREHVQQHFGIGIGIDVATVVLEQNAPVRVVVLSHFDFLVDYASTGSAIADASGKWVVSGFGVLPTSNTFSAKQVDVHGNESVLSNLWTVSTTASSGINGNFESGPTGFDTDMDWLNEASTFNYVRQRFGFNVIDKPVAYDTNGNPQTVLATLTPTTPALWNGVDTWSEKVYAVGSAGAFEETDKGYYTNSLRKFGLTPESGSDFATAPEMSKHFGHTLAHQRAR